MTTLISDILLSVAYRRGEDSLPNDANESQRRLLYAAEAYRKVNQSNIYWFHEKVGALASIEEQNSYPLFSDFRDMIEVRVDNIIRSPVANFAARNEYNYPSKSIGYINFYQNKNYYLNGNEIVLLPATPTTLTPLSITIASVGTLVTVTSSIEHGLQSDDYVTVSGANEVIYNGQFRVIVTGTNTFTYNISTATTGSGTGTIIATINNIRCRYYCHPSKITSLTDTVLIPDQYCDILVAYICGRLSQLDGEKGDAADSFAEFEEIKLELNRENLRRGVFGAGINSNVIR